MRSKLNKDLNWQQQRELWNQEGYCSRESCGHKHDNRIHSHSNLKYCNRCAFLINDANQMELIP